MRVQLGCQPRDLPALKHTHQAPEHCHETVVIQYLFLLVRRVLKGVVHGFGILHRHKKLGSSPPTPKRAVARRYRRCLETIHILQIAVRAHKLGFLPLELADRGACLVSCVQRTQVPEFLVNPGVDVVIVLILNSEFCAAAAPSLAAEY